MCVYYHILCIYRENPAGGGKRGAVELTGIPLIWIPGCKGTVVSNTSDVVFLGVEGIGITLSMGGA
jgi:hypothetical protein